MIKKQKLVIFKYKMSIELFTIIEPKSRSQSEQPASCPICGAVIKQSRNLRRHLELRHFSKPAAGIKRERKSEKTFLLL